MLRTEQFLAGGEQSEQDSGTGACILAPLYCRHLASFATVSRLETRNVQIREFVPLGDDLFQIHARATGAGGQNGNAIPVHVSAGDPVSAETASGQTESSHGSQSSQSHRMIGQSSLASLQIAIDVYESLLRIDQCSQHLDLVFEETICDLLYHLKYMFVGDGIRAEIDRQ